MPRPDAATRGRRPEIAGRVPPGDRQLIPAAWSHPAVAAVDEDLLVERARAGDEEAREALVRFATPTALAAARRISKDPALAEDAAQEAFLRVFRALDRFQLGSSFRAWVRTIAIRCAIDQLRRLRPESPLLEDQAAPGCAESRLQDVDLLRAALASLSPIDREILIAREVEGASDREIAARLAMRVTAIRVRVHRARRRIRARFREVRS